MQALFQQDRLPEPSRQATFDDFVPRLLGFAFRFGDVEQRRPFYLDQVGRDLISASEVPGAPQYLRSSAARLGSGVCRWRIRSDGVTGRQSEYEWELFDLKADPYEMKNVVDEASQADVRKGLTDELHRLQDEVKDERYHLDV